MRKAAEGSSPLARGLPVKAAHSKTPSRIIPARAGFTWSTTSPRSRSRDHPRSRGVYSNDSWGEQVEEGSSPLARGLPGGLGEAVEQGRIIPARAGFTGRPESPDRHRTDHPRSRGVYTRCAGKSWPCRGSSPLARGLPAGAICPTRSRSVGIIPARAGFTRRSAFSLTIRPDHPRSRGVYPATWAGRGNRRGSSPLARGLPPDAPHPHPGLRIIPARAGFTYCARRETDRWRDHPRSRGVYDLGSHDGRPTLGSSPLARGLPATRSDDDATQGIIPACAGFYPSGFPRFSRRLGSSPLARGLRWPPWRATTTPGIIPARAGSTYRPSSPPGRPWDHPRSRGVYDTLVAADLDVEGSSPLARGLLISQIHWYQRVWIIPARAGFTDRLPLPRAGESGSSPLARGLHTLHAHHQAASRIIPARAGFTVAVMRGRR